MVARRVRKQLEARVRVFDVLAGHMRARMVFRMSVPISTDNAEREREIRIVSWVTSKVTSGH